METERFYDAVNVILSLQSTNGGFPACESQRAYQWVEKFNPTEFFEDTMIEVEYVECTASAIQRLALFQKLYPKHRRTEIDWCIEKGLDYLEEMQNPHGNHWRVHEKLYPQLFFALKHLSHVPMPKTG